MSAISGKNGSVLVGSTAVAHITSWTFDKSSDMDNFASSSTAGYQANVEGTHRANGSFDFKIDDATPQVGTSPVFVEGTSYTLKLYLDSTRFYTIPARIGNINISVTVDGGPAITGSASFNSNGAWTEPTF